MKKLSAKSNNVNDLIEIFHFSNSDYFSYVIKLTATQTSF